MEYVRRGYGLLNESGWAIAAQSLDPEVVWHSAGDLPDSGTYVGQADVAAYLSGWAQAFEDFRAEPEEFIDAGDRVLVVLRVSGRPKESRQTVEVPSNHVHRLVDGVTVEAWEYRTKEEALRALGLAP